MVLLEGDKRQVKDANGNIRTVFRIYYYEDIVLGDYKVNSNSIGGYAEVLENITSTIILNNAVVLKESIIENCIIRDDAYVFSGNFRECIIEGRANLSGNNVCYNSIFSDSTTIKGNFKIDNCLFSRCSYASGYGTLKETTITGGGHIVNGNVNIENCRIEDTAEVTGNTKMKHSCLSGRVVVRDGNIINQNLSYDYTLNVTQGVGEPY